jgi:catechol 2,3-dioxygenase-like lactoylglutathione lyase family enzyme
MAMALASAGGAVAQSASTAATPTPSSAAAPERVPTDVRRTTIIVADLENSLRLYRDVLGLKVNYDAPITVSGVALPAGKPGNKTRLVLLQGNDGWVGWIGLLEFTDPPLPRPRKPYPKRLGIGGHVIVMNTTDVDARCARAAQVPGVHFTAPARDQSYPGRNGGPPIIVRGCNFFDPDGTFIELNQTISR